MSNIQTFKINMVGRRVFTIMLETYGMNEWSIENALDVITDEISKGRNVEGFVHYI